MMDKQGLGLRILDTVSILSLLLVAGVGVFLSEFYCSFSYYVS